MKIRKVRLGIQQDVPMGVIIDLKETIRYRMLLNIIQESYQEPVTAQASPVIDDDEVKIDLDRNFTEHAEGEVFKELRMVMSYDPVCIQSTIRTLRHENGQDLLIDEEPLEDVYEVEYLANILDQSSDRLLEVSRFRLAMSPDVPQGLAALMKTMLRSRKVTNLLYESYANQQKTKEI